MFKSKRLYINSIVFGSFLFMPIVPWYLPFAIAGMTAWYMTYYEFIALGFLMDIAYGSASNFSLFSHHFPLPLTVLAMAILFIFETLKKRIRTI